MIRAMHTTNRLRVAAALWVLATTAHAQVVTQGSFSLATQETPSGYLNINAQSLPHWRAAMARVRAGTGRAKILIIGDSTTMGAGAGTGGTTNLTGAWPKAWPRRLAQLLNTAGLPVSDNSLRGDQNVGSVATYPAYDTRVTLGAGWAYGTLPTIGGGGFHFTVGAASTLAFTPAAAFDTMKIWYIQQTASGTFTSNIDGGASQGTLNANNAVPSVQSATYTVAKATHTININAINDNPFWILGIDTYDSTVSAVDLLQGANYGSLINQFASASQPWTPLNMYAGIGADLTIINETVNDSNAGTALATYQSQMQSVITATLPTGDVILMVGPPSNTAQATNGTLDGFVGVLRGLALSNNVGLVNLKTRWVSYAATNPLMPYFDTLHPQAAAYADIAAAVLGAVWQPLDGMP